MSFWFSSLGWQGIWHSGLACVCRSSRCFALCILPVLVAALVVFLGYFFAEWEVGEAMPGGWGDLKISSLGAGVVVSVLAVISLGLAHLLVHRWPHWCNAFAVAGVSAALALSRWPGTCEPLGGLVAGFVVVALLFVFLLVCEVLSGSLASPQGLSLRFLIFNPSSSARWDWTSLVFSLRCGLAIYMALLLVFTFYGDIVSEGSRPLVLVFAGVGLSAAGSLPDERGFRGYVSLGGVGVSLVGSYMQVDRALIDAWHLLVAVLMVSLGPFASVSAEAHILVKILGLVVLAVAIFSAVFIAIVMPALLIMYNC